MNQKRFLGELEKGQKATIVGVGNGESSPRLIGRLLEMGFVEGAVVEVLHEGPVGGDPIAVRVRGTLVALRRNEANQVQVQQLDSEWTE